MPSVIILSDIVVATTADILQGTRLQTVPAGGILQFEVQADINDASSSYDITIQMPGGDVPISAQRVPSGNTSALAGIIDNRTAFKYRGAVTQGGHCVFGLTETGTAVCAWRVVYIPAGVRLV